MSVKAIDLRRGMAVSKDNGIWIVVDNQKVAKGNWRSYQVVKLKNFQTGQSLEDRYRTDELFEQAMLERKELEYLYSDATNHIFMDPDSFEQVGIAVDLVGDEKMYLVPNLKCQVAFVDSKAVTVELPFTVEMTVVETPPGIKGATATNQMKDAVCESGARIRVPAFVENGTKIKVDTRTGEYLGRA